MAYDYAERLCDFRPNDFHDFRPNDFATFRRGSATLTELPISRSEVGGSSFSLLIGVAGSTGAAWALPGFRPDRGGVFTLYNV